MKTMDRPLVVIVVAVVILLVIAIIIVMAQPPAEFMPEGEPQAAAYNYLLALFQGDYERAYGYLSPDLPGYPGTLDEFIREIRQYPWQFGLGCTFAQLRYLLV